MTTSSVEGLNDGCNSPPAISEVGGGVSGVRRPLQLGMDSARHPRVVSARSASSNRETPPPPPRVSSVRGADEHRAWRTRESRSRWPEAATLATLMPADYSVTSGCFPEGPAPSVSNVDRRRRDVTDRPTEPDGRARSPEFRRGNAHRTSHRSLAVRATAAARASHGAADNVSRPRVPGERSRCCPA